VIAVDTNVLVRLLVADDRSQHLRAMRFFDAQAHEPGSLWVSQVVLAELGWVLSRTYGRTRADVAQAVRALAGNATVSLEQPRAVEQAVDLYEGSRADLADCLLSARAQVDGLRGVVTFDRGMRGLPGVSVW
jgi:predicted nucleic-acid-binding protein